MANNPYQIYEGDHDLVVLRPFCECCRLRFEYKTPRLNPGTRVRCGPCAAHVVFEPTDVERLAQLVEHEPRMLAWLGMVRVRADTLQRQVDELESGRQLRAALDSRDRYQAVAAAIGAMHREKSTGRCGCGHEYPCKTVAAMLRADPGVTTYLTRPE